MPRLVDHDMGIPALVHPGIVASVDEVHANEAVVVDDRMLDIPGVLRRPGKAPVASVGIALPSQKDHPQGIDRPVLVGIVFREVIVVGRLDPGADGGRKLFEKLRRHRTDLGDAKEILGIEIVRHRSGDVQLAIGGFPIIGVQGFIGEILSRAEEGLEDQVPIFLCGDFLSVGEDNRNDKNGSLGPLFSRLGKGRGIDPIVVGPFSVIVDRVCDLDLIRAVVVVIALVRRIGGDRDGHLLVIRRQGLALAMLFR